MVPLPIKYFMNFSLKEELEKCGREETYVLEHENNVCIKLGSGEMDYLNLHYGDNGLITNMVYQSKDLG